MRGPVRGVRGNMKLTNEWIVGFVDGDGCFKVYPARSARELHGNNPRAERAGATRYCFVVSQEKRSKDVFYPRVSNPRFGETRGPKAKHGGAVG